MKKIFLGLVIIIALTVILSGRNYRSNFISEQPEVVNEPFNFYSPWVDSVFNSLTADQRIGQLFFAVTYSNHGSSHVNAITNLINNHYIGGLIFFQGGPVRQALLTNHYQELSNTPLLIAQDAEWGLGMRLDSCVSFPRQMALDAIEDLALIYRMGAEIGRQLRRLGVHLNFSPVAEDSYNAKIYMSGLQEQRILTSAQLFHEHGNRLVDPQYMFPILIETYEELDTLNIPGAIAAIKTAINNGCLDMAQIEMSCRRILAAKEWAGLNNFQPVNTDGLIANLNSPETELLNRQLVEASLTVVQNRSNILPLKQLGAERTAILITGMSFDNTFLNTLRLYEENNFFFLHRNTTRQQENALFDNLRTYTRVIVGIHNTTSNPAGNYGILPGVSAFVDRLAESTNVVLCLFAPPYALSSFSNKNNMAAIVVSYQDTRLAQDYTAQLLYGAIESKGKLPVSVGSEYRYGMGVRTAGGLRLKYSIPEEVQIASEKLSVIDEMVLNAINAGALPGCQILVARNGVVFFNKEYGKTRYDNLAVPVTPQHIYDLASISKIAATLPAVMALYDQGNFNLQGRLVDYLPELRGNNKANITMIDLLTHQSRLPSHINFYFQTIEPLDSTRRLISPVRSSLHTIRLTARSFLNSQRRFKHGLFSESEDDKHRLQVAEDMYIINSFRDTIFNGILDARLLSRRQYVYSDLGFIMLEKVLERLNGQPLDEFVAQRFYRQLGASTLAFNPLKHFPHRRIVPTSNDTIFRKQWLQGYINDENAALMGGIAGHAGLFGNANDLAKLMQMFLNMGTYGGERYVREETLAEFTKRPFARQGNRRGIGFDKPNLSPRSNDLMGNNASGNSFGHTGFTGTMTWADPDNGLLFVFLSNRVCPDVSNNQLAALQLRALIYEALVKAMM